MNKDPKRMFSNHIYDKLFGICEYFGVSWISVTSEVKRYRGEKHIILAVRYAKHMCAYYLRTIHFYTHYFIQEMFKISALYYYIDEMFENKCLKNQYDKITSR